MKKSKFSVRQKIYNGAAILLNSILSWKRYPDLLIGEFLKKEELSSHEKAVIVELIYGILRHLGKIDYIIEHASRAKIIEISPDLLNPIRICVYHALFTDSSETGIINNAIAMSSSNIKYRGFVKRTVEAILRNKKAVLFPDKEKAPIEYITVYYSHRSWIVEKWLKEFGSIKEVEALCSANNFEPPLTIRGNPLMTDVHSLKSKLEEEGYSSSRAGFSPYGLIVGRKEDIFKTGSFKKGFFEVQDEGSQLVTMLTGAKQGELVIDTCAGNGGKSLFLSGIMKNRGSIIAYDISPLKLKNLKRRAAKSGAFNIKTVNRDALNEYDGLADRVLIDAPCSGMGVFRRNPDAKWKLTQEDISELCAKQKEMINDYSRLVKPGGRLVYVTCTISLEENEEVIYDFMSKNPDFYLIPVSSVNPDLFTRFETVTGFFKSVPHVHNTDGFFGAVVEKK